MTPRAPTNGKFSKFCTEGRHAWCMNRSPEESHCACSCHKPSTIPKPREPRANTQLGNTLKLLRQYKNGVSSTRLGNLYGMEFGVANPNAEKNLSRLKTLGFARRLGNRGYWIATLPDEPAQRQPSLGLETEFRGTPRPVGREFNGSELAIQCERAGVPVSQRLLRELHDLNWVHRGVRKGRGYRYGADAVIQIVRMYKALNFT